MSGRRFYLNIKHRLTTALNPALCQLCGIPVSADAYLCIHCQTALRRVPNPCLLCGLPNLAAGDICAACLKNPPRWARMAAPLIFGDHTRQLLLQLKYAAQLHQARVLLTHIVDAYRQRPVEVLLPVPAHRQKLIGRGYNQAHEIAKILSERLSKRLDDRSLSKIRQTGAQSGLNLHQRRRNIRGAFEYRPLRDYRSVAIVDDIITSGSTMNEICRLLHKAGVDYVEVWSVARTLKN